MAATKKKTTAKHKHGDPGMLWQSYQTAMHRKELDVARERITTYFRLWVEAGEKSVVPSPEISKEFNRFGLLSCPQAFALPGEAWHLTPRPTGILEAVEHHLEFLKKQLISDEISKTMGSEDHASPAGIVLQDILSLSTVLARVAGVAENYSELIKGHDLISFTVEMVQNLMKLISSSLSDVTFNLVLQCLTCCMTFIHCLVDPRRNWQRQFMSLNMVIDPGNGSVAQFPGSIVNVFIQVFNSNWNFKEAWQEAWLKFQMTVLHVLGAMLCSSKDNAYLATCHDACFLLLSLLDPREKCSPIQVLTTKVMIKTVHILHNTPDEIQVNVDKGVILVGFLNMLSPRYHEDGLIPPCVRMIISLLDVIPRMMKPSGNDRTLKELFVDLGCFEKICESLTLVKEEASQKPEESCVLVCQVFRAFTAVMKNCPITREWFERRVGHYRLTQLVSTITQPSIDLLQEAMNMIVEGTYKYQQDSHSIYNTSAITMLLQWLPTLAPPLQRWLARRLYDLCTCGPQNKQRCCTGGVLKSVVEVLTASQEEEKGCFSDDVEEHLVCIIQVLGSHSIGAAELKLLIGALRPLEGGELPTYYFRLQRALSIMASEIGRDGTVPLYYFDLRKDESYIGIPDLHHFPTSSHFTFNTWVFLDPPLMRKYSSYTSSAASRESSSASFNPDTAKRRRTLYSFYTSSGTGFEAFFTSKMVLVVATVTKKEFITTSLKEFPLTTQEWHNICIVYHVSKRPWGKSEMCVYIDGELKKVAVMKAPNFSDTFTSACIGYGLSRRLPTGPSHELRQPTPPNSISPKLRIRNTSSGSISEDSTDSDSAFGPTFIITPLGGIQKEWGEVANLRGLVSSLTIFGESLSATSVKTLYKKGPNDLSLFQPKCAHTQDLSAKLFVYYHAKAVKEQTCLNLSPHKAGSKSLNGRFIGQHYITWDIKAVIGSVGGVELLYPILEQVHLPIRKRVEPNVADGNQGKVDKVKSEGEGKEDKLSPPPIKESPTSTLDVAWWFDDKEGVASFLKLLLSMLDNSPTNQQVFFLSEGPATIGALLQKVPPSCLTVQALTAIQQLTEQFSQHSEQRYGVYKHLLFNFKIWSRPSFSVRIGHTQYIATIVKDHQEECRENFGVQFMLDVIRVFYSSMGGSVPLITSDAVQLTEEEQQSIRAAIIMNLKLYVMEEIHWEEVDALLSFLAAASDSHIQEEILRFLYNLLTNCPCQFALGELLWEKGIPLLVLVRGQSMSVRLLAIKILAHLQGMHGYSESGLVHTAMKDGSLAAAIYHMTDHQLSSSIILALMELCVAKNSNNYSDYISNLNIYLQVLQLLRKAPLTVRYTICQQVLEMLYNSPHHVSDIAQSHGWESLFLWQLTPNQEAPTISTPVVVQFESKEFRQPRNGEGEGEGENGGSSYQRIDSNLDPSAKVEKLPPVTEQEGEDPTIKTENSQDKNRIEEESSTNVTTNENGGGGRPQVPSIAVTPDQDSSTSISPRLTPSEEGREWVEGDSETRYPRSRSKVIVNPPNTTRNSSRPVSISSTSNLGVSGGSGSGCGGGGGSMNIHGHAAQKRGHGRNRGSLTYSKCWDDEMEESDDIWRTCNIVTETLAYILWRSTDNHTDRPPWKVWGKFFAALDNFSSEHQLLLQSQCIKQRVFILLINAITLDIKEKKIDRSVALNIILQLCELIESFILIIHPSTSTDDAYQDEEDVILLKLAHNFLPQLNTNHCNQELLEQFLQMLTVVQLFDNSQNGTYAGDHLDVCRSAIRILLTCIAREEKQYYVIASLKLEHLVKCPSLPYTDVHFILSSLARSLSEALDNDEVERPQYVASVMRGVFTYHAAALNVSSHLPSLPSYQAPSFTSEILTFSSSEEWQRYKDGVLKTEEVQYGNTLLPWLQRVSKHRHECYVVARKDEEQRRQIIVHHEDKYQQAVSAKIYDLHEKEVLRERSTDSQEWNDLSIALHRWRGTRRFFTGERGAWSSRKPEPYLWKMDRTENFSRMRMKLSRNYNYNTHADASHLRDTGSVLNEEKPQQDNKADVALLAKVTSRKDSVSSEEDDVLLEQFWSDANAPSTRAEDLDEQGAGSSSSANTQGHEKEKILKSFKCNLIVLMDRIPGRLDITTQHLYFFSDHQEKKETQTWYSTDFKVPLSQLREIHSRRYNMSRTALEIFFVDQTNYFLNFPEATMVRKVYREIISLRPPNLNRVGIQKPARLLQQSGLKEKWVRREISTFDYLIQLNTIAGRTYNDLNQYPIFPWVLNDYTSSELDLTNPDVFRDFSKPVGIQNPDIEEHVRLRYEEVEDPMLGRFHFGSHYSNAAGVMHYLIRLEPFTTLHIELQSGKFDFADRQFFSIPSTWSNIYKTGLDVKELIPEFFYQPEFLKNINEFDLGKLQTGRRIDDVELPAWAESPEEFIVKHREALESEYVSANLHHWIDLIFGYKQTGPEAEKAGNVFNYYSYEDNVNLETVKDEKERRQIESIINNFGQTPTQLFTEPHPQRLPLEQARRTQAKGFTAAFIGKRSLINLFEHLSLLKAHSVDISEGTSVVFVRTPSIQTRALLISGNPEQLVTINAEGQLNIHGWLPFSSSKNRHFTFNLDPNSHFEKSRWHYVGGPFAHDLEVSHKLFVLSPNNKYLVTAGHWDNSLRVHSIERTKITARVPHHNDVVTCMALDKAGSGDHLITGSRDTTCAVWKLGTNGSLDRPLQALYGHNSEVLCADISTELDLAVSGSKDGTCLLHTVRHGRYLNTLQPRKGKRCEVQHVALSGYGILVLYTEDTTMRHRALQATLPCIHLYTINGRLLKEKELKECLNCLVIVDKYLITGNMRGYLIVRDLFTLTQLHNLNLLEPIRCISVVLDHHTKVCTHFLVGLDNGKLIIVSVKDVVPEGKV